MFAAAMGLHAILVPLYHGPDESKHVDMLFAVREPGGWPGPPGRRMNEQVVRSTQAVGFEPGRAARTADEAVPRAQRPALEELAPDTPSEVRNQMWQHPPLGYVGTAAALGVVTAVVPASAGWSHDQVIGLARLLDGLVLVPLPLFAYWAARRLTGPGTAASSAAVLAAAVPAAAHIGGTVTNDGLLVALLGLLTVPLVHVATGDLSLRTAAVTGVVAGLALLTKGFALFAPLWIASAYALAAWRGGPALRRRAGAAAAVAAGLLGVVGGWWWLRNLLQLGVVQPQGIVFPAASPGFVPDVGSWVAAAARLLPRTFWGYFGWIEAPLPWPAVAAAAGVVTAGVALAVAARPPQARWRRADVALLLGALAGTAGIMLYGSWSIYAATGERVALHGRYLLPGLVGLAVAAALGLATAVPTRWRRALPAGLLAGAGALHVTAFAALLDRYWMPAGATYAEGVGAALAWSPWEPTIAAGAVLLGAGAFGWALVDLFRGESTATASVSSDEPTRSSTAEASPRPQPPRPC